MRNGYKNKYTVDDVIVAVKSCCCLREVLDRLGVVPAGGNYTRLKKIIKNNNIDISHFRRPGWSKGIVLGPKVPIETYLFNGSNISSFKLKKKLLNAGLFEHKCYSCGLTEWLGKPIPLELEHIDGVRDNNTLSNLTLLCPNCHAQTDTYRGKNIGKNK